MVNVQINMSSKDYAYIVDEMMKAMDNTFVTPCLEETAKANDNPEFLKIVNRSQMAYKQLEHICETLGISKRREL